MACCCWAWAGFIYDARAVVNFIGNGVATVAIARCDNALDLERMRQAIREQRGEAPLRLAVSAHAVETVEPQG